MTVSQNILIPDGDSTWALTVLHCLSQIEGYNIFVLSNKKRTAIKFSKYITHYKFHVRGNDENWLDVIKSEVKFHAIDVIVPIAEKEAVFFIKNKINIQHTASIIPLPELANFEIAIDKKRLSDFAKLNQIPHPKSYFITSETGTQQVLSEIEFPILVKPLSLKGGDGIQKINTKNKFESYFEKINHSVFVQEFIEGYDIDCSVICLNGTILNHTIQKGNLKGDTAFAPQLAFDFLNNDGVLKVAKEVMSKLNWSGIAHLDMRYDTKTNNFKLIEINARFWGSIEGSRFAGINFPHQVIELASGKTILKKNFEPIHYMRLKGVLKHVNRNPLFLFKRHFLLNNTEVKMFLSDPLPTFYKFREWLGRRF